MSLYEQKYGTDWDTLDKDAATERAYAIGVAEKLGEYNREELEAIYDQIDTAYNQSMVELAYSEGRQEAADVASSQSESDPWDELVEGDTVYVEPENIPTGGRDGLPEALGPSEILDKQDVDSTEVVDRPEFLDK
jgi:hypothetical protein